jgi:hypothetical protein
LVKKFRVLRDGYNYNGISPEWFNRRTLRQFSALTNVQELEIYDLDIPNFMPRIRQYFGHFLPTLRSLALGAPKGCCRQILFFIGLFQHLEDLTLFEVIVDSWRRKVPADDLTLIPLFVPPLRGRLVVACLTRVAILKDMIDLFGGIRFRYMDLFDVKGMRLLLNACAKTLESLQLYPNDPRGEQLCLEGMRFPTNDFTAKSSLRDFNLSGNTSLQTFEVAARSTVSWGGSRAPSPATLRFLRTALSTITSPAFSEVIVFYQHCDFLGVTSYPRYSQSIYREMTPADRAKEASWHRSQFGLFREMYAVRGFRLVLCADVWDAVGEYAVGVLKRAVAVEKAKKRLDYLPSEPLVIYDPKGSWKG